MRRDCIPGVVPRRLAPLEYPDRFEVPYVGATGGGILWNKHFVTGHMRIENVYGRLKRKNVYPMCPDYFVTDVPDRSHQDVLRLA